MSYDLHIFRRKVGLDLESTLELVTDAEEVKGLSETFRNDFEIDKRAIADSFLAADLSLHELKVDFAELAVRMNSHHEVVQHLADIELLTNHGAEPPLEVACGGFLIGISFPYWVLNEHRKAALEGAITKIQAICEKHGMVLYDPQLHREVDGESVNHIESLFKELVVGFTEVVEKQTKHLKWKFWG